MRVIDSSALSKYVNREDNWKTVGEMLEEGCTTLDLAIKEVANGVWKRVIRGELTRGVAVSLFKDFVTLRPFKTSNQENLYVNALGIAIKAGITFYDGLFIQLSKDLNLQLVTSDKRQAEASRRLGIETIHIE